VSQDDVETEAGVAQALERHVAAARAAGNAVWEWDLPSGRIHVSGGAQTVLGLGGEAAELTAEEWLGLVHPADLLRLRATIDAHLEADGAALRCEHRMRHATGEWRWVLTTGLALRDPAGAPLRLCGTVADITFQREADATRGPRTLRDPLTGLANRALVIDRAGQLLRRATREPACAPALLLVDVDGFHRVEERFGRGVGDGLLAALARRLASQLRPGDTAARVGDDEFALLLDTAGGEDGARTVARRVLAALKLPFAIDDRQMFISATIGMAVSGPGMEDGEELLLRAEAAMYSAKHSARGGCVRFQDDSAVTGSPRSARHAQLRQLIDDALLTVHFQPIVALATGRIQAFEAFARWSSDAPDAVPPLQFVPIAEELGLIGEMSFQVMSRALAALTRWRNVGLIDETVSMSVNISRHQLEDPELPALVRTAVAAGGLPGRMLRLDVGERALGEDSEYAGRRLTEVCDSGVALHLDDFGTGKSSLAALSQLPVAALKIDRSVVSRLGSDRSDGGKAIARTAIALAQSLGVQTIAEGVEEQAQLDGLRELGCDAAQGFLFSAPLPASAIETLLAEWQPALVR
jgi:diguanylate cyclase (GGDEF)-like protein/PAS domain S-box-containing protein